MFKKISLKTQQKAFKMYQSGMSSNQIAKKLGISQSTICRIVRRSDGKVRTVKEAKGITSDIEQQILAMYQSEMSSPEIAEKLGISPTTVTTIVRRLGGKVRSRSDANTKAIAQCQQNNMNKFWESDTYPYFTMLTS